MWSMVQSPPTNSFSQCEQIGSKTVFAYALAFAQACELCHSAIVCLRSSLYKVLVYYRLSDASWRSLDRS